MTSLGSIPISEFSTPQLLSSYMRRALSIDMTPNQAVPLETRIQREAPSPPYPTIVSQGKGSQMGALLQNVA